MRWTKGSRVSLEYRSILYFSIFSILKLIQYTNSFMFIHEGHTKEISVAEPASQDVCYPRFKEEKREFRTVRHEHFKTPRAHTKSMALLPKEQKARVWPRASVGVDPFSDSWG